MKLRRVLYSTTFTITFCAVFAFAQQEQLTITTYYPSPNGMYHELGADRIITNVSGNPDNGDQREAEIAEFQAMRNGDAHIDWSMIVGAGKNSDGTNSSFSYSYLRNRTPDSRLRDGEILVKNRIGIGVVPMVSFATDGDVMIGGGRGSAGSRSELLRIRQDPDYFGADSDAMIIQKTDNDTVAEGGLVLGFADSEANSTPIIDPVTNDPYTPNPAWANNDSPVLIMRNRFWDPNGAAWNNVYNSVAICGLHPGIWDCPDCKSITPTETLQINGDSWHATFGLHDLQTSNLSPPDAGRLGLNDLFFQARNGYGAIVDTESLKFFIDSNNDPHPSLPDGDPDKTDGDAVFAVYANGYAGTPVAETEILRLEENGNLILPGTGPGTGIASKPGGGPWADSSSDIRLKKNVQPIKGALDKMLKLRGVNFEWVEPKRAKILPGTQMGMIAQDAEKVFPQWVVTDKKGYKNLVIKGFEALTVEAMRELKAENQALKLKTEDLEARIKKLETRINSK